MKGNLIAIYIITTILLCSNVFSLWEPYIRGNWTFDVDPRESINGYNSSTPSAVKQITGWSGNAYYFNGSNSFSYGDVFNFGGYNQNPSNVTINAIIFLNSTDNSSGKPILASDNGGGGQYGFNLELLSGNLLRVYYGYYSSAVDGNKNRRDSIYPVPADRWVMVTGSMYNQTELRIFVNGVEVKGTNLAGYTDMSQRSDGWTFAIGYNAKDSPNTFRGGIDDTLLIRNYINVTDAYEIASMYGLQNDVKKQPRLNSSLDNLAIYEDWTNTSMKMNYSGTLQYPDYVLNAVDNTTYPELYDCYLYVNNSFQDLKSNVNLSQQNFFYPEVGVLNATIPVRIDCENEITNGSKTWNVRVNTLPIGLYNEIRLHLNFNDANIIPVNEVDNTTGGCTPPSTGYNPPSYDGYIANNLFDESWDFRDYTGQYGDACYVPFSQTINGKGATYNVWFKPSFANYVRYPMTLVDLHNGQGSSNPIHQSVLILYNDSIYSWNLGGFPTFPQYSLFGYYNFTQHQWYMLTATFGARGMELYVNGDLIASNSTNTQYGSWSYGQDVMTIGRGNTGFNMRNQGNQDETTIWSRQLLATEIKSLFDNKIDLYADIKENTSSGDTINQDLKSYHTFDVSVKDDLGYVTYQKSSAIIDNTTKKLGEGSLYCRGTARGSSNNTPTFNFTTISYGSWFKAVNSEIGVDYLYAVDGNVNSLGADNTLNMIWNTDGYLPIFNDSLWHSSIMTWKRIEHRWYQYVDGTLLATWKSRTSNLNLGNNMYICRYASGGNSKAYIDDVFVFNRTLSDGEISYISAGNQLITGDLPTEKCYDVISCPIRRYSMDELNGSNVNDYGLNNVDGTTNITYSGYRPLSFINRGLSANDTTKQINIPNNGNLAWWDVNSNSISFWLRKTNNPSNTQTFLRHITSISNEYNQYFYMTSTGVLGYCVGRYGIDDYCTTSSPLLNNGWYMITGTFNRTDESIKLHINDTKVANSTLPLIDTIPSYGNFEIKQQTAGREFNFSIDELRFYDWDITPQVPQLYNYLVSLSGCLPEYEQINSSCTINNTYTTSYYDIIQCGLPPLNDTISVCDYCVPTFSNQTSECQLTLKYVTYNLTNYETCCALTNDYEDCTVPIGYSIPCSEVGFHQVTDLPSILIDFFVEYMLVFISLVGLLILLLLFLLYKYLKDKRYV